MMLQKKKKKKKMEMFHNLKLISYFLHRISFLDFSFTIQIFTCNIQNLINYVNIFNIIILMISTF